MSDSISIVWFRLDLRLADNLALRAALSQSEYVVPIYIWNPEAEGPWAPGAASRWWLHQSLEKLDLDLQKAGARLVIAQGNSKSVLQKLAKASGAKTVFWNKRYDPIGIARDADTTAALRCVGIKVETFNSTLLHEPMSVCTKQGQPFKVFTPFWNCFLTQTEVARSIQSPKSIRFPAANVDSLPLKSLALEPTIDWTSRMKKFWTPGEAGAQKRLKQFLAGSVNEYATERDRPDHDGVSMLSPHLHFGEIGPRQIWQAVRDLPNAKVKSANRDVYLKELGWREFAHHILFHFPSTAERPLREQFAHFPWRDDVELLRRWQKGNTGYPIVDAGMRQLWELGWMHNRVRMIVASFLTKDLLISWTDGANWFWDTLVDADLANNTLGWQWASGCGADAAPYFRIFNPELQGEKFDPAGDYVRRWVPELAKLPARWIHKPWKAPAEILGSANVVLGGNYPKPVIEHSFARKRALEVFSEL